jgi:hypothetical protein
MLEMLFNKALYLYNFQILKSLHVPDANNTSAVSLLVRVSDGTRATFPIYQQFHPDNEPDSERPPVDIRIKDVRMRKVSLLKFRKNLSLSLQ